MPATVPPVCFDSARATPRLQSKQLLSRPCRGRKTSSLWIVRRRRNSHCANVTAILNELLCRPLFRQLRVGPHNSNRLFHTNLYPLSPPRSRLPDFITPSSTALARVEPFLGLLLLEGISAKTASINSLVTASWINSAFSLVHETFTNQSRTSTTTEFLLF